MGQWWATAGLGALTVAVLAQDLLKEVTIIFITSTEFGLRSNNWERTQPFPPTENWVKDLLSLAH